MRRTTRVTLVQFSGDGHGPDADLDIVRSELRRHRDSDLVIFPEFALRRTEDADVAAQVFRPGGPAVIFGQVRVEGERSWNHATYADGRGASSYTKTHVHWTEGFTPGSDFPVIDTPLGPTGMLICFDAAFGEVPAVLTRRGAKAIVNISAIPSHFPLKIVHRRLVACSVLNQVFTFFVNRTGAGYLGGSAVVDPQGEILAVADDREPSITIDVDMAEVDAWRAAEPFMPYRRPELYGDLADHPLRVPVQALGSPGLAASTAEAGGTY